MSNFLIPISLQRGSKSEIFKIIFSNIRIHSLKYQRSTPLSCKDIGIKNLCCGNTAPRVIKTKTII